MLFSKFPKLLSLVASVSLAALATSSAAELTTYQLVTHIFENKCYSCHSEAKKKKSGLTLDSYLILFGTPLGSTAVTSISKLKTLKTLYVAETGLSSQDLDQLRKIFPDTIGDDFLAEHPSINEEKFPKSTPGLTGAGENLALHKPVTATSSYKQGAETFPAEKLTDGLGADSGTPGNWSFWLADNNNASSITIDLQKPETIALIELENTRNRKHGDRGVENFTLETSDDGITFKKLAVGTLQPIASQDSAAYLSEKYPVQATTARYLRLNVESYIGNGPGLNEIKVYSASAKNK